MMAFINHYPILSGVCMGVAGSLGVSVLTIAAIEAVIWLRRKLD